MSVVKATPPPHPRAPEERLVYPVNTSTPYLQIAPPELHLIFLDPLFSTNNSFLRNSMNIRKLKARGAGFF
ncbi:MAG: hypothetical protein ACM3P0_04450, partial [Acidobacteriota bacterium]